jgi:ribonuclease HI
MDALADTLSTAIFDASNASIPRTSITARSKPWWNDNIRDLRKHMARVSRKSKSSYHQQEYRNAKNRYFNAIKRAKIDHWNQFLEKEDPKSIFKAMSYTKDMLAQPIPGILDIRSNTIKTDFGQKCEAFRTALFPKPPTAPEVALASYVASPDWNWPVLSRIELQNACTTKIKGKTPGPDLITQEIITQAYDTIPDVFYGVFSILLNTGHHPKCWKQATGIILKKPGKPDYSAPKAYRVISLLNCLGKISERVLAQRLTYLAETTSLLHPSQIGGRLTKSAIDTALLLTNEIEQNKLLGLKTSTLFLDVKGAFDHVAKNQLIAILRDLKLPKSLLLWVSSFLDDRRLQLTFNSNMEEFKEVKTGIPQGSPISPILFLIYIRGLFTSPAVKYLSYIDDISITVASTSYNRNIRLLEREVQRLIEVGEENAISFDIAKTELIHYTTSKEAKKYSLGLPGDATISPKTLVKWLGIYFDPNLTFKQHVAIRASQAKSAYLRMARLANSEKGLTPFALRQLYLACVVSVADYGSIIWWRNQKSLIRPLQAIQNLAVRKILGVFKTAPIMPMEVEAALVPPQVRLNSNLCQYAFRMLKLSLDHPINLEIGKYQLIQEDEDLASKYTKPIQIERIYTSISGLVDLSTLEPIEHFKYAPWNRSLPYAVKIDNAPKDEAATNHNKQLLTITGNSTKSIYTDASALPTQIGVGAGFAVFENIPLAPVHTSSWNIGDQQIVYNGELDGITKAIEYAGSIARVGDHFDVYSDNQAGIYRLAKISDNPGQSSLIRCIEASHRIVSQGATVTIHWVPGHEDILGNELADELAKEATQMPPESQNTSFALLGLKINELRNKEWALVIQEYKDKLKKAKSENPLAYSSTYSWRLSRKLNLPQGVARQTASSFYQLKIGHGYLKHYLYRIQKTTNDHCRCRYGQPETAKHLLTECRDTKLRLERSVLEESLGTKNLTLPLLLHTTVGIQHTLKFLTNTGICTRKWHMERNEQIEEEEQGV